MADYLSLRATNDEIRSAGVSALFEALTTIVNEEAKSGRQITATFVETHNFTYQNANISGSRIEFRIGIRCLTVEAGWTRTPTDGFMRGGALAIARFHHFGIKKANVELFLVRRNTGVVWMLVDEGVAVSIFAYEQLKGHIDILIA